MAEFDPVRILRCLDDHEVRYVVIGAVAARLWGAPLLTADIDITPADDPPNLAALSAALRELGARLRTANEPEGVEFPIEPELLAAATSWTLTTRWGDLDLVFLPSGSGGYRDLIRDASNLRVSEQDGLTVMVASLSDVVRTKEAAGRDKDRAALPLLRKTLEESYRSRPGASSS
ncbi:MAG TPA: hypothetical protein VIL12_01625 [Acidimicrobiia bacterium]